MRRAFLFAILLFVTIPICGRGAGPAIVIDPLRTQGTWEGWGVSLRWWAKVLGDRSDIADVLFTTKETFLGGKRLPGLGLNIARYNAGACSWNEIDGRKMVVSKTILPYRQIEGFWLDGKKCRSGVCELELGG